TWSWRHTASLTAIRSRSGRVPAGQHHHRSQGARDCLRSGSGIGRQRMVKRRRSDLDAEVYPIRARQRAALVRDVLHRGEVLAADPAVCVLEQIEPARAVVLERDAGLVFATDRRLLYRALNSQHRQAWPYRTLET